MRTVSTEKSVAVKRISIFKSDPDLREALEEISAVLAVKYGNVQHNLETAHSKYFKDRIPRAKYKYELENAAGMFNALLQDVFRRVPGAKKTYPKAVEALVARIAEIHLDLGEDEKALDVISKIPEEQITGKYKKQILWSKAVALVHICEFENALRLHLEIENIRPTFKGSSYQIGICYAMTNQWELASPYLAKLEKIKPNDYLSLFSIGVNWINKGFELLRDSPVHSRFANFRIKTGLSYIDRITGKAIQGRLIHYKAEGYWRFLEMPMSWLVRLRKLETVMQKYQKIATEVVIGPVMEKFLLKNGEYAEALKCFNRVFVPRSNYEIIHVYKGVALAFMGRVNEALPYFEVEQAVAVTRNVAICGKALAFTKLGYSEEKVRDCLKQVSPKGKGAYGYILDEIEKALQGNQTPVEKKEQVNYGNVEIQTMSVDKGSTVVAPKKRLGQTLREDLVDALGLTVEEAADKIGLSHVYTYQVFGGQRAISRNVAVKLSVLFDDCYAQTGKRYTVKGILDQQENNKLAQLNIDPHLIQ